MEFISFRENVDTSGPLGRAITVIIGCVAELEHNLIIERVRAGMRRAKLEGQRIGRQPLAVDRLAVVRDRARGLSLAELAKLYRVSRSSICRVLRDAQSEPVSKGVASAPSQLHENRPPKSVA